MDKTLLISCPRAEADDIEAKLLELDPNAKIEPSGPPKLQGAVEIMSIAASVSTIAASTFVIWAEVEKRWGDKVTVKEKEEDKASSSETDGDS